MACVSMATSICFTANYSVPSASLSLLTGSRTIPSRLSLTTAAAKPHSSSGLLHCSFVAPSSSLSFSSNSSFAGSSLGLNFNLDATSTTGRGQGLVVRAKKYQLCQTKRNRSRKSLARTHGFRKRMRTTSGRAVIKRRRAKGRWDLCPKSNPNSGKRA
ncbi:hypothetical protein M9H77_26110 [Catharanthus roseus]|uniref:Uncharacterized protein n=1 Tax=Catharanthus roseus TaxID=4058 RepID=A0ACC0ABH2_CATRO|nr:hypothetical protein M9H77_26110 [Catharanthus roseus]